MGKIKLLAVAAAGIYCKFKSVTSLREEGAVPMKDSLASHSNLYASALNVKYAGVTLKELPLTVIGYPARALSVDQCVEAWPEIPSIGLTRRPAPGRSRGRIVRLQRSIPA